MRWSLCSYLESKLVGALVVSLIVGASTVVSAQEYRSIDGSGNNVADGSIGSVGMMLMREVSEAYEDGVQMPGGMTRPSARLISNVICDQTTSLPNSADASDFLWQWGQFLDHDIDLSPSHDFGTPGEQLPIPVPAGDPHFDPFGTGTETIGFMRSLFEPGSSPRQQINMITTWIDASNVYGSDVTRALALRTLDGTGRLRTSAGNLLPFNEQGLPNAAPPGPPPGVFFLAGDERCNEQVGLISMHTLFMREHNRLATQIAAATPGLSGDEIYLRARRLVGAEMQRITFEEFLPLLLGPGAIPPYAGYDPTVDGSIRNLFSTACYRVGHTMLSPTLLRLGPGGQEIPEGNLPLAAAFFAPNLVVDDGGIEPILRGLALQRAQSIDTKIIGSVRNFLFGPPGAGGFDLASLNIQRGRDHGLPSYADARVQLGLAPVTTWSDITSDPEVQTALAAAYPTVGEVDLWIGGLAEDHVAGALVGELFHSVLSMQFRALRDGDRFWYENDLEPEELALVNDSTLSRVILRNTSINTLPADVFRVPSPEFVRGECDGDGLSTLADAIVTLDFLFNNGPEMPCMNACDVDGSGTVTIGDPIYTLVYLFSTGPTPSAPFPDCGSTGQGAGELPCYESTNCP